MHSLSSRYFSFVTSVNLVSHHGKTRLLRNNTPHLFFLTHQQIYQLNFRNPSRRMFLLYSYYCSYSLRHHLLPLKPSTCTLTTLWTFHWNWLKPCSYKYPRSANALWSILVVFPAFKTLHVHHYKEDLVYNFWESYLIEEKVVINFQIRETKERWHGPSNYCIRGTLFLFKYADFLDCNTVSFKNCMCI